MTLHVACSSCRKTFDAIRHAGLVRCEECLAGHALRLPGSGAGRLVVL